jgi:hypothetical protein
MNAERMRQTATTQRTIGVLKAFVLMTALTATALGVKYHVYPI